MGAGAIFRYLQQIEKRIEDAEARVAHSQQAQVDQLTKELTRTRATLARKTQALVGELQLNCQLVRRIRELEREIERGNVLVERDSHNSSLPPSLDPPWQKVRRTRSLRKRSGMKAGGQTGHPGRMLKQIAQPDEIIIHRPVACRNCSKSLKRVRATGCVRRQVLVEKYQSAMDDADQELERCAESVRDPVSGASTDGRSHSKSTYTESCLGPA